jgi:hypothetical protein
MCDWRVWRKENVLVYLMPIEHAMICPQLSCYTGEDGGHGPGDVTVCSPQMETIALDIWSRDRCFHVALPPLLHLRDKMALRLSEEGMVATQALLERMGFVLEDEVTVPQD